MVEKFATPVEQVGFQPEMPATGSSVVAAHEAKTDPHTQYHNDARGDARYEPIGAVAAHEAAADPHTQYLTPSEGDAAYEVKGAVATHEAAADPHAQYQKEGTMIALVNHTVVELGALTPTAGHWAFCTDEVGGSVPVFGDGTNWRRCTDRAIVS